MNQLTSENDPATRLEVFFDGQCPLCRREIDWIRGLDRRRRLILTDIANPSFDAKRETGQSLETLMREIHARLVIYKESEFDSTAKWFTGVDVFREMYSRIGFKTSVWISELPLFRPILHLAYRIFAYFRFKAAMKRILRSQKCAERCDWSSSFSTDEKTNGVAL